MNSIKTALSVAVGIGLLAVSGCSGNQAIQQQLDAMEQKNSLQATKINNLEGQLKALRMDYEKDHQLLEQFGATITAQKEAIDRLDASIKAAVAYPDRADRKESKPAAVRKTSAKSTSKSKSKSKKKRY